MEKILVISYRFPPADETGTQRTWALAKYLGTMGFYPVFITRNWDVPLKTMEDRFIPVGEAIKHEVLKDYEVFSLPNKNMLQLKVNRRFKTKFSIVKRIYNFMDAVLMNWNCFILDEYNAFIKQADSVVRQYPEIRKAIVIADPFPLFYIGYRLKKKFGLKWIADYRDDWTTRVVNDAYGFRPNRLHKFIHRLAMKSEKKWVSTAGFVTSVSEEYTKRISRFVGVKGVTIYNGFFEEDYTSYLSRHSSTETSNTDQREFVILHSGTLYPQQQMEIFTEGLKGVIDKYKQQVRVIVKFLGVLYKPGSEERIRKALNGYEENYTMTLRLKKEILFEEIYQAQIALVISHGREIKGIPTSKIFDYIALKKKVLCCPSDGDVLEAILTETGLGYFCNTPGEVHTFLSGEIDDFLNRRIEEKKIDYQKCLTYSRRNQTKVYAQLLAEI